MAKKINYGKRFEEDFQNSSKAQQIYTFRVRDVNLPPDVRMRVKLPKNRYDYLMYYNGYLFPSELKSNKSKSISFDGSNPDIKEHQMQALTEDAEYEGVIPGFILNYRSNDNRTFFIHIDDFNKYVNVVSNGLDHDYTGRTNEKSLPITIAEQIGTEIRNTKKRTRYTYMVKEALDKIIKGDN